MQASTPHTTTSGTKLRQLVFDVQILSADYVKIQYHATVWKEGNDHFYSRRPGAEIALDLASLKGELIPKERIYGPALPDLLQAPVPITADIYVKTPRLVYYNPDNSNNDFYHRLTAQEVKVLEFLSQHPHPNITTYYGVVVEDGRIIGLALKKYKTSLYDLRRDRLTLDADNIINGLKAAVEHLHGLGFVHNDINPANIMLDDDSRPILIDFDSSIEEGEKLVKGGTPFWHKAADPAVKENDWGGVELVRKWLHGEYQPYGDC